MQNFMEEALARINSMSKEDLISVLEKHKIGYIDLDAMSLVRIDSVQYICESVKSKTVGDEISAVFSANDSDYGSMALAA